MLAGCISKYEWGTDIDHDIKMLWNKFLKNLLIIRDVSVRRHYFAVPKVLLNYMAFAIALVKSIVR